MADIRRVRVKLINKKIIILALRNFKKLSFHQRGV